MKKVNKENIIAKGDSFQYFYRLNAVFYYDEANSAVYARLQGQRKRHWIGHGKLKQNI